MKSLSLTGLFASVLLLGSIACVAQVHAQDDSDASAGEVAELALTQFESKVESETSVDETAVELEESRKIIVIKDGDENTTIDLNIKSGQIVVRSEENGEKEKVTIDLGSFIGENVLREIAKELEKEGVKIDGKIVIDSDSDREPRVVVQSSSNGLSQGVADMLEALVSIVAIVLIFGMPVLIVGVVMYGRFKRRELVNKSIESLIESGREIPAEVFREATGEDKSAFSKGVMLIAIGLALMFFLSAIAGKVGIVGLIPAAIGLAHIIIWKAEERNKTEKQA